MKTLVLIFIIKSCLASHSLYQTNIYISSDDWKDSKLIDSYTPHERYQCSFESIRSNYCTVRQEAQTAQHHFFCLRYGLLCPISCAKDQDDCHALAFNDDAEASCEVGDIQPCAKILDEAAVVDKKRVAFKRDAYQLETGEL